MEEGKTTVGVNPANRMECRGFELCGSFEELFLKQSFYLGEHKLDRVLESLYNLSNCCKIERTIENGLERSYLIQVDNFRKMIQSTSPKIQRAFKLELKGKTFSYIRFSKLNNLRYGDLVSGVFPMVFTDLRRVLHCLKLARAIYLTLLMKKIPIEGPTRLRGGKIQIKGINPLTRIFSSIYYQLRKLKIEDEVSIIKCFKTSLCYLVSEAMDQEEFPIGTRIEVLPSFVKQRVFSLPEEKRVNVCFSILQSKSLCQEVPSSFVLDALKKHRNQLSSPHPGIDGRTLQLLEEEGRIFGRHVQKYYKPNSGFFPTGKATFAFPRNKGGIKGDLVYQKRISNNFSPVERQEPLVIGLFGQPGQGKSLMISRLKSILQNLFPGVAFPDLTYARTTNCSHWDGYKGQPITILDDLGQGRTGTDIQEFQTLVSCNQYVLPMADLREKGMMFKSSIIIVTTNIPYGMDLHTFYEKSAGIIESNAFWRRFHIPIYMENHQIFRLPENPKWIHPNALKTPLSGPCGTEKFRFAGLYLNGVPRESLDQWVPWNMEEMEKHIRLQKSERDLFHLNHCSLWKQVVFSKTETHREVLGEKFYNDQIRSLELALDSEDEESVMEIRDYFQTQFGLDILGNHVQERDYQSAELLFDAYPTSEPLKVRVEPITEPLKVRTITAGQGETFCLKPLQRAMWLALGDFPQYKLTHGTQHLEPCIQKIFQESKEGDVWISGDYTAATDSVAMEASRALMKGILSQLDHLPTKRWAMKELEPHLLVYPESSGLEPILQKSGQLMGSFLSFPLLCLLNNCTAKFSGLQPHQYLINGDDILMRTRAETYPLWKEQVKKFGLELSLGKNYLHPTFGTVNSQLIFNGTVLQSGKQRLLDRRTKVLGECLRDLELQMDEDTPDHVQNLFKRINRKKLGLTVRSIRVPVSHGGLSLSWGSPSDSPRTRRTEILVYLSDLFRKLKPKGGFLSFPYLSTALLQESGLEEMVTAFNEPVSNTEYLEDFLQVTSLQNVKNETAKFPSLSHLFFEKKIEDLPPLSFIQIKHIPYTASNHVEVQKIITQEFLSHFLQYKGDFNYMNFRKRFLQTVLGLQIDEIDTTYLVNLFDQEFSPSLLDHIRLDGRLSSMKFDSLDFERKLGVKLTPKLFDLPDVPLDDYLLEFEQGYMHLQESLPLPIEGNYLSDGILDKAAVVRELKSRALKTVNANSC